MTHWREKLVYLLQLMPSSHWGDVKTASGGKVRGWKRMQGGVVCCARVLTATKWHIHPALRADASDVSVSVSSSSSSRGLWLACIHFRLIPTQCSNLLCPTFSCPELKADLTLNSLHSKNSSVYVTADLCVLECWQRCAVDHLNCFGSSSPASCRCCFCS